MALKDWKKIKIQDDNKSFWIKYRNEKVKREIHIANQNYGKSYYVEMLWLTPKYKLFKTKQPAITYAKAYMKKH